MSFERMKIVLVSCNINSVSLHGKCYIVFVYQMSHSINTLYSLTNLQMVTDYECSFVAVFDAMSIMREYLKDEPWMNLLCNKLK